MKKLQLSKFIKSTFLLAIFGMTLVSCGRTRPNNPNNPDNPDVPNNPNNPSEEIENVDFEKNVTYIDINDLISFETFDKSKIYLTSGCITYVKEYEKGMFYLSKEYNSETPNILINNSGFAVDPTKPDCFYKKNNEWIFDVNKTIKPSKETIDERCYVRMLISWYDEYSFQGCILEVVDALYYYDEPKAILVNENQTLNINETFQTSYYFDVECVDERKIMFISSDPNVASVDENGLVTTHQIGESTITVKYNELCASYKVTVLDNRTDNVVIDGKRDDEIWKDAKEKPLYLTIDNDNFEDFYAVKGYQGVYISADLYTKEVHDTATEWWQGDNFELKLSAVNERTQSGRIWFSTVAGNSNMQDVACTSYNKAKGMQVV